MLDNKKNISEKLPSSSSFGYTFFIIFIALVLFFDFQHYLKIFFALISLILLLVTMFKPSKLDVPNKLWYNFGQILGKYLSPLILLVLYIVVFLPIGVMLLIFQKDKLNLNIKKKVNTNWSKVELSSDTINFDNIY